jgi:hypothetical protein
MKTAAPMMPFFFENESIRRSTTAGRKTGSRRASEVAFSPSLLAIARAISSTESRAQARPDDVRCEHEGNPARSLAAAAMTIVGTRAR